MTNSAKGEGTATAFATLRIAGDELVPAQITEILAVWPTRAHARGEVYDAGPRARGIRGKTGVWLLSSEGQVSGASIAEHLRFLLRVLDEPRRWRLRRAMERQKLSAVVSCFWSGPVGSPIPTVPASLAEAIKAIPAKLETDFDADWTPPADGRVSPVV